MQKTESSSLLHKPLYLDGLRGIASWMVVFGHLSLAFWPELTGSQRGELNLSSIQKIFMHSPFAFLIKAHFAVLVFFVHSGLVLSYKFFTLNSGYIKELSSSAVRRYFRLAGPAAGSILFAFILLLCGLMFTQTAGELSDSSWLLKHFTFRPDFSEALRQAFYAYYFKGDIEAVQSYNSSLWSIYYEMLGSFLIFGFLALFGKLKKRWFFYIALSYIFRGSFLLSFIYGIVLCDIFVQQGKGQIKKIPEWGALLLFIIGMIPMYFEVEECYSILGAAFIVLGILNSPALQRFFNSRVPRFLGHISYSVYLIHLSLICSLGAISYVWFRNFASGTASGFAASILVVVAIVPLSMLYYRYVDLWFIAKAKVLEAKYFSDMSNE